MKRKGFCLTILYNLLLMMDAGFSQVVIRDSVRIGTTGNMIETFQWTWGLL